MQLPQERVPYTREEEQYIVEGVQKLGHRWRHILSAYPFHPHRTPVDIKDKYRLLIRAKNDNKNDTLLYTIKKSTKNCFYDRSVSGVEIWSIVCVSCILAIY